MLARSLIYLHELRRNLRLKFSDIHEIQTRKLRAVIRHAYANVPFYKRKFDQAGIKPEDIKSFADLPKIPLTTRSEIQGSSSEEIIARDLSSKGWLIRATSGSSGIPLRVFFNQNVKDFWMALWLRAYFENGLRLRDSMMVIGEPEESLSDQKWFQRIGIMKRQHASIFDDCERQLTLLRNFKPNAIKGYPTSLAILADACKQKGTDVELQLAFTLAELLDPESRKLINSVFRSDVLDNYASSEFGPMAWECKRHMGFHLNVDSVVIEFIDGDGPVALGERGEIVCTGLINRVMPLIRYQIGDVGIPIEEKCPCGRMLPLMRIIEGRKNDFMVTTDGRVIPPTVFFPYPFDSYEKIKQFRVTQEARDRLTIQLVLRNGVSIDAQTLEKARTEIRKLFGEGMQTDFQILEKINNDTNGKTRKIISHVPVKIAQNVSNILMEKASCKSRS